MKTKQNIIPIVFATNENYAPYAAVAINSLIENASPKYFYDINVFYTELPKEYIDNFELIKGSNYKVKCICINSLIEKEQKMLYTNFHFSKEMYYRLLIPKVFSKYEKVIYLDCDIVVLGDISEFYKINIDGYLLGGIKDVMHKKSKDYVANTLGLDNKKYINSGVLLMNIPLLNKMRIKSKCFELLKNTDISYRYPDQDILNITCKDKIKFLDYQWNYIWHYHFPRYNQTSELLLPEKEQSEYIERSNNIKILHYTSNIKPWNNYNNYLSKFFFNYVQKTNYFSDIIYNRYNKIPNKNYIVLHFLDDYGDRYKIKAAYMTLEDYLYHNHLYQIKDGKKTKINFEYSRNIEIENRCYSQNYFSFYVLKSEIKNGINISFIRENYGNKLLLLSGKNFPLDRSIDTYCYDDNNQISITGNILSFKKYKRINRLKKEIKISFLLIKKWTKKSLKSLFVRMIYWLTKYFVRKPIWLISDRIQCAGDNGEALFKYLSEKRVKSIKYYFVMDKNSKDYDRLKQIGKVVKYRSLKFDLLYLLCTYNISSQLENEIIKPYNVDYIKDLMHKKKNVFLQHGVTKDDLSRAYNRSCQDIKYFMTVSKAEKNSIQNNPEYLLDDNQVLLTGLSRFDYLKTNQEKIIYIVPTWRKYILDKELNLSDNYKESTFYKEYNALLHSKSFISMINKNNYKVVFAPHCLSAKAFIDLKDLDKNIEIDTNINYTEMFNKGALLITDYSSCSFDMAYLKKPVIYYQFDKDEFYNLHTYKEGYYSYVDNGFGEVVYSQARLLSVIESYLSDDCKMKDNYISRVQEFYKYIDSSNCERTYNELIRRM